MDTRSSLVVPERSGNSVALGAGGVAASLRGEVHQDVVGVEKSVHTCDARSPLLVWPAVPKISSEVYMVLALFTVLACCGEIPLP